MVSRSNPTQRTRYAGLVLAFRSVTSKMRGRPMASSRQLRPSEQCSPPAKSVSPIRECCHRSARPSCECGATRGAAHFQRSSRRSSRAAPIPGSEQLPGRVRRQFLPSPTTAPSLATQRAAATATLYPDARPPANSPLVICRTESHETEMHLAPERLAPVRSSPVADSTRQLGEPESVPHTRTTPSRR